MGLSEVRWRRGSTGGGGGEEEEVSIALEGEKDRSQGEEEEEERDAVTQMGEEGGKTGEKGNSQCTGTGREMSG